MSNATKSLHRRSVQSSARAAVRLCLAAVCVVSLQACGGSHSATTGTVPAANQGPDAAPTSPPVSGPVTIGAVVWASAIDPASKAPLTTVTAFPESAAVIYAVVPVANVPAGAGVTAVWTYNGVSLDSLATTTVAPQRMAAGWLEFHASMTPGKTWPAGAYAIVVKDGGTASATGSVVVSKR